MARISALALDQLPDELNAHAAARYVGCHRSLIQREALHGRIRTKQVGGLVYYSREDIDTLRARLAELAANQPSK